MVECLDLKPFCSFVNKLFCSRKRSICEWIRCSKIFPGRGKSEMGRRSSGLNGFDTLGMGTTVAFFHLLGKVLVSIDLLIIVYNNTGLFLKTIFHILEATEGNPLDLNILISFIFLLSSSIVGYRRLKVGQLGFGW